jgi:hypothetical protein
MDFGAGNNDCRDEDDRDDDGVTPPSFRSWAKWARASSEGKE